MAAILLTPSTLRWTTLSFASKIEGKSLNFFFTLFTACGREGRPAKRRRGESTG